MIPEYHETCNDCTNEVYCKKCAIYLSNCCGFIYKDITRKTIVLKKYKYMLGALPDREVGTYFNCSGSYIHQLRQKYDISCYFENNRYEIEKQLLDYLVKNKECVNIQFIHKNIAYSLKREHVSKEFLISLANKNNFEIKFYTKSKYDFHYNTDDKCKCDICKLANTIRHYLYVNFKGIKKQYYFYFANKYIEIYKNDKSKFHKDFYDIIRSEISDEMLTEK